MINKNNNNGDIYNYLKKFIIAKGADFTHTSMGEPLQSYYIQSEDYNKFLIEYCKAINNKEKVHITEKHKTISPIFNFDAISSPTDLHSNSLFTTISNIYYFFAFNFTNGTIISSILIPPC